MSDTPWQTDLVCIRKDNLVPRYPWHADMLWRGGVVWHGWLSFFRSRKALIEAIKIGAPHTPICDPYPPDKERKPRRR